METKKSEQLSAQAKRHIAGGVNSQFRAQKPYPLFFSHGKAGHIVDVDGNEYIDYTLSQGPVLLGHGHEGINQGIQKALDRGILFAGQHDLEIALADRIAKHIPCAEVMRLGSTGSEMAHAALRAARYLTGRQKVLKFEGHYHGWYDSVAMSIKPTPEEAGDRESPNLVPWTGGQPQSVTNDLVVAPFNDRDILNNLLDAHDGEIAAVIMEPIMCNNGCIPAEKEFVTWLREECSRRGIVLIFDEIITGFRLGLGGAQSYLGVTPDMAIFGKGVAAGLPLAMVVGQERFMAPIAEGKAVHAGTYNSNTICTAAALASIEAMEALDPQVLFEKGQFLMEHLDKAAQDAGLTALLQGPGPMFHMSFTEKSRLREFRDTWACDEPLYHRFVKLLADRGVRVIGRGLWYVSYAHSEDDLSQTVSVASEALRELAKGEGA